MISQQQLLEAQEQAAVGVASLTGLKRQLVDSGWSEHNAELAVIEIIRKSS